MSPKIQGIVYQQTRNCQQMDFGREKSCRGEEALSRSVMKYLSEPAICADERPSMNANCQHQSKENIRNGKPAMTKCEQ